MRLPKASSCATLWRSAGEEDCSKPAHVLLSGALQVHEAAQRQQARG